MKGLYISGAKRSPPNKYINPAFLVVCRSLWPKLREVVIVTIAVIAQRIFKVVNLWL
jgi:hypothetical protein